MTSSLMRDLIRSLFVITLATPVAAEQLEPTWQEPRNYFNKLSDRACEGDQSAHKELFESAVTHSNPVAMNDLGWLSENQHCSFSKENLSSAALKYKRSAQDGYPIGQSNYARILMEGEATARNPELAKEYYYRAIDAGYGDAAVALGLYYLSAEFLPIDDTIARSLYQRAVMEGADPARLEKLAAALEKNDEMSGYELTEIDGRPRLFTHSWDFGYGEARWDYAPNGKFESRVSVGVFEDTKSYFLQMMRDSDDPIIRLRGVSVEHSNEALTRFDLSFCQKETCTVNQYGDNFGSPGSSITITIPRSEQVKMLEALKSGSYVIFHYETEAGIKNNTLSLQGSRRAIDALTVAYGLSPKSARKAKTPTVDDGDYGAALEVLIAELNLIWSPKDGNPQSGRQKFEATERPCVFTTLVNHPNTGKTTQLFNLGHLDPAQITWEEDFFFGRPSFFSVKTLGNRRAVELWTDYPTGEHEFETETVADLYIGLDGNFAGIKPHLATAIRHCNRVAQQ